MNLLYLRFWSGNLVEFTAMSPMTDSNHQNDERGGQNLREKGEKRKNGTKMNLLYQRFWSGNIVDLDVKSLMVDSDRQTDERGGQNLREKKKERKKKLVERWWFF